MKDLLLATWRVRGTWEGMEKRRAELQYVRFSVYGLGFRFKGLGVYCPGT